MIKSMITIFLGLLIIFTVILVLLYSMQEKLIFFPQKLGRDFQFTFSQSFREINIKTKDNILLHGILFKADSSKGVIFYLHGNAGSLRSWGEVAETYTALNYDVFMLDYRGYGKSEGSISSEAQLYSDNQSVYDYLKTTYREDKIIVLGYSIGTGPAAKLASTNKPAMLILQAPYYSLVDLMRRAYPFIPTFILKYKFETNKFIRLCNMPVVIFHGKEDEVVYYESSVKLKPLLKTSDRLITLNGEGHNGMSNNSEYLSELRKILVK